jgi:hypothetical protein
MITLDEMLQDCQDQTSDTTADSQAKFIRWLNQGYQNLVATFGRPGVEKVTNTTTNAPSSPLVDTDRNYQLPPDFLFFKTIKIQIGSRWYQLIEEEATEMWNYRTEYAYSGIPSLFYVNENFGVGSSELQIDPICMVGNAPMKMVYESSDIRLDHLAVSPVSSNLNTSPASGTLTFTYNSNIVSSTTSIFQPWMSLGSTYITAGDDGDGNWYKIIQVNNSNNVTIGNVYQSTTTNSTSAWSINQIMSLHVDMQDIPEDWALWKYYKYKKDAKWRDYYMASYNARLIAAKGNWATKSRSSIIRSKNGLSRWHSYPGWFPAVGVSS